MDFTTVSRHSWSFSSSSSLKKSLRESRTWILLSGSVNLPLEITNNPTHRWLCFLRLLSSAALCSWNWRLEEPLRLCFLNLGSGACPSEACREREHCDLQNEGVHQSIIKLFWGKNLTYLLAQIYKSLWNKCSPVSWCADFSQRLALRRRLSSEMHFCSKTQECLQQLKTISEK